MWDNPYEMGFFCIGIYTASEFCMFQFAVKYGIILAIFERKGNYERETGIFI